ncbi:DUF308 domain-containing protein [Ignavigranum ruoffiae]|uniref:DUF308 domain-containing protein n=1 Tax=Ignavigranum ruoffiae TaxID=89093 RepID=A0A1H9FSS8_9LACT|nr:DUF308 domain-containing protein [Ignavigranum ruoffiae]SEQ40916.1 Short repeat of unknown function [Ignavigranum ruoffiae]
MTDFSHRRFQSMNLFTGCLLIGLVIALYIWRIKVIVGGALVLALALLGLGLWQLYNYAHTRRQVKQGQVNPLWRHPLVVGLIEFALGIALITQLKLLPLSFAILLGLYQLLMGLIGSLDYFLNWRDRARNQWSQLVNTLLHLAFAVASLFLSNRIDHTLWRFMLYLLLLALNFFYDSQYFSKRWGLTYQNRFVRTPLPLLLTVLMPYQLQYKIQNFLAKDQSMQPEILQAFQSQSKFGETGQVEVFIHTSPYGFDRFGHADIAFQGKVYSYGNHDADSRKLFEMIGDGVVLVADRQAYIDFMTSRRITMISFGIQLNAQEETQLSQQIERLLGQLEEFELTSAKQLATFVGIFSQRSSIALYKFKQGLFKTYFVLGSNCVMFVDYLLQQTGIDILAFAGIMTPGSYYDYFNKEFHKADSKVVSKSLLNRDLLKRMQV